MQKTLKNLLMYILTSAAFLFLAVGFLMPKAETAYADEDIYYTISFDTTSLYERFDIMLSIPTQYVKSGDYAERPTEIEGDIEWWGDSPSDFDFEHTPITSDTYSSVFYLRLPTADDENTYQIYQDGSEVVYIHIGNGSYTEPTVTKPGYTFNGWSEDVYTYKMDLNNIADTSSAEQFQTISIDNNDPWSIMEWEGFIGYTGIDPNLFTTTDSWFSRICFYDGYDTSVFQLELLGNDNGHQLKLVGPDLYKRYRFQSNNGSAIDEAVESSFRTIGGLYAKIKYNKFNGHLWLYVREDNDPTKPWISPISWGDGGTATISDVYLGSSGAPVEVRYEQSNVFNYTTARVFSGQKLTFQDVFYFYSAQFTQPTYTVTFVSDGQTIYTSQGQADGGVATAAVEPYSDPTKAGYTFLGWFDANDNLIEFPYNPTADITVYAGWEEIYYTISFYADNVLIGTAKDYQGTTPDEAWPTPTKLHYTFSHWEPYAGYNSQTGEYGYEITEDTRLDAVFTLETYIISFWIDGEKYDQITVVYGDNISYPEAPRKAGYTFLGWQNDNNETPKTASQSDIFRAVYKKDNSTSGAGSNLTTSSSDKGEMFISCGDFNLTGGCGGTTAGAGNGGLLASVLSGIIFMVAINALRRKKKTQ